MLREANKKFSLTSDPSIINTFFQPKFETTFAKSEVFAVFASTLSTTISSPAVALAESACLRPSLRNFFVKSCACDRTFGPLYTPPPRKIGAFLEP